jgi:malonyl CoA-acyl carrier protein transacylase
MKYEEILDIAQNDDEIQHLRALISARGARMDEEVDTDFLSMLAEEGYNIEEVA